MYKKILDTELEKKKKKELCILILTDLQTPKRFPKYDLNL